MRKRWFRFRLSTFLWIPLFAATLSVEIIALWDAWSGKDDSFSSAITASMLMLVLLLVAWELAEHNKRG